MDSHRIALSDDERQLLSYATFRVENGRRSFFASILGRNQEFFRFDPACMKTTDRNSQMAQQTISNAIEKSDHLEVEWKTNKVLVIDNWRSLHSRSSPRHTDDQRLLKRILVS